VKFKLPAALSGINQVNQAMYDYEQSNNEVQQSLPLIKPEICLGIWVWVGKKMELIVL